MMVAVLSKDYEPLTYCRIEKAIVLLYLEKAEAVQNTEQTIRSVSSSFRVPSIIRLLHKTVRRFIPNVRYSRRNVLIRDKFTCQYCASKQSLTVDHVLPISRGGKSSWENVVAACRTCNGKKGNKTLREAGMVLRCEPTAPRTLLNIPWNEIFD